MIDFTGIGTALGGVAAVIAALQSGAAKRAARKAAAETVGVRQAVETPPGSPSIGQQVHEARETLNGRTVGFAALVDTQVLHAATEAKIAELMAALVAEHVEARPRPKEE